MHAENLGVKQRNIRGAVLSFASINGLIVGDVGDDIQLGLNRVIDGLCLGINLLRQQARDELRREK